MPIDPPADPPALTDDEALVLALVDGERTLREIAEIAGFDEPRMRAVVASLEERGVLGADASDEGEPSDETTAMRDAREPEAEVAPEPEPETEAATDESATDATEDDAPEDETSRHEELNYRRTFDAKFRPLPSDARVALAREATGGDLCALCLDPDPKVVAAALTNATFGLPHARLVALHHRTAAGLDHVASRRDLLADGLVLRRLLRNPQLAAATFRRLVQPRRLPDIYKLAIDRELPELARVTTRGLLRTKFASQVGSEERAELIVSTEARALALLSGCTFDARTTQILCGRQVYSALFIQNVARFGAAPPALLAHLAKLPFVRRNPGLKKALMQHPNLPGDVKRSL